MPYNGQLQARRGSVARKGESRSVNLAVKSRPSIFVNKERLWAALGYLAIFLVVFFIFYFMVAF